MELAREKGQGWETLPPAHKRMEKKATEKRKRDEASNYAFVTPPRERGKEIPLLPAWRT
jgi:hypothetical protein